MVWCNFMKAPGLIFLLAAVNPCLLIITSPLRNSSKKWSNSNWRLFLTKLSIKRIVLLKSSLLFPCLVKKVCFSLASHIKMKSSNSPCTTSTASKNLLFLKKNHHISFDIPKNGIQVDYGGDLKMSREWLFFFICEYIYIIWNLRLLTLGPVPPRVNSLKSLDFYDRQDNN